MVGQKNPQLLGMIWPNSVFKGNLGDFLVIQWLRIHLPLDKGTQVRSLVQKLKIPHPARQLSPLAMTAGPTGHSHGSPRA